MIPSHSVSNLEVEAARLRNMMVDTQLRPRGIDDPLVLEAMLSVPRHHFVDNHSLRDTYADHPLPIGHGQTISQPYIVALMSQLVHTNRPQRIFEVGTGCGYQTAVLARMGMDVFTVEIVPELAALASERFQDLQLDSIQCRHADGHEGWLEQSPFDAIMLTAAPSQIPRELFAQLRSGGHLIGPVGTTQQSLMVFEKISDTEIQEHEITRVRFVPMTGRCEQTET